MTSADSVSIFAEGTFEEQTQELVNYLGRDLPENERASFIRPFQDSLKTAEGQMSLEEDENRRRKVVSLVIAEVHGLGDGSDREIEGFFNLLYSHLLSLFSEDSPELSKHVVALMKVITSSSSSEHNSIKYRILTNLFNAIPRRSSLRLLVCKELLRLATEYDELEVLQLTPSEITKWTNEWNVSAEEKSEFWKAIGDAYATVGQPETAYAYSLDYVRSIPLSSPSSEPAALEAIASSLRLASVFNFDPLLNIEAVQKLHSHELFSLLQIFTGEGLAEYRAWEEKNETILEKYGLEKAQLDRKMRLLVLASLGSKNIGRDVPYPEIASTLQVEQSQVEKWVIDVIRVGLLSGKLSQTSGTLHVTRSTARSFGHEQWGALERRLLVWKSGLAGVLEVVVAARLGTAISGTTAANGVYERSLRDQV